MKMEQFIRTVVTPLVDFPDNIRVIEENKGHEIVYTLSVNPEDMGKIIGKQGRVAKAIRTVVQSAAMRDNKRVFLEIR
ncbi:MAG: RNA-binding protein [Bacillales bacterium]|jgi:predicted RNA-binding protein YlqC (UPF0109 family)|nr:RNA-binding protein [Bacillales bacterium]